MNQMDVLNKIIILIGSDNLSNDDEMLLLPMLVEKNTNDVKCARNYPESYTEEQISNDLGRMENIIIDLVIYDYNMRGAEFESSHSENGIGRNYRNRDEILDRIIPFAKIIS
jgi:hypothetical protein